MQHTFVSVSFLPAVFGEDVNLMILAALYMTKVYLMQYGAAM